jgi:hypothetical protein
MKPSYERRCRRCDRWGADEHGLCNYCTAADLREKQPPKPPFTSEPFKCLRCQTPPKPPANETPCL